MSGRLLLRYGGSGWHGRPPRLEREKRVDAVWDQYREAEKLKDGNELGYHYGMRYAALGDGLQSQNYTV